jgi:Putative prokaryotic signal transducing protein
MTEVSLTVVPNELEADMICGMLQANGISCSQRSAGYVSGIYGGSVGSAVSGQATPTEILVPEAQLEAARKLLTENQ